MMHTLKCWPAYFAAVLLGVKTCEVRRDDRGYAEGDTLHLREWDADTGCYTGREIRATITHVLRGGQFGIEAGWVVLSVRKESSL